MNAARIALLTLLLLAAPAAAQFRGPPPPMPAADGPPAPAPVVPGPAPLDPAKPWLARGLSLPAPLKIKEGRGFVLVAAVCDPGRDDEVTFDLQAQFRDTDVVFEPARLDATTMIVPVPGPGVIQVSAYTSVAGKPTKPLARTFIEVSAREVKPPAPDPKPPVTPPAPVTPTPDPKPAPPAGPPPAGTLSVVMVAEANTPARNLSISPSLSKSLRDLGALRYPLTPAQAADLAGYVKDAGGAPALLVLDAAGKVFAAVKMPDTEAGVLAEVKRVEALRGK